MKTSIPETVSVDELANIIGKAPRTVRKYISDGILSYAARGKIDPVSAIRALLKAAERSNVDLDLDAEKRELAKVKRAERQAALDERLRKLVPFDEANTVVAEVVGTYRAELGGLAARVGKSGAERAAIQRAVDDTQARVHDLLAKRLRALQAGKGGER